ncbi:ExeA family protein [Pelovirga terrestris]|uniref:AAA family ATPase n=1 Tax=Pelovirga terrestris TaxID=2771352 RepID=A0A8J6UID3_9BACT|nr:AAA family ATPase [Pelovirga terrestris]MBD1400695.1 AAA family ATPase [Pelovirga terrestris]
MYKEHFGFKEDPFSIAPDPQFLYMSEIHREALAHLLYGMKADSGFVLLTGEVGTGKTTVCRCLLNQIPDNSEVAFILNPKLSVLELLATICDELGIAYPAGTASIKVFVDCLNLFLLDAHSHNKRTILIIDEAQNLSVDVLEQIRLLTNLETDKRKLLQVILLGQPELNQLLERAELRQLSQRVTARYHLEPLLLRNISAYLGYRLAKAGVERPLFTPAAIKKLYRLSGGVPRLINLISDRALLGAYSRGEHQVRSTVLTQAAREIFGAERKHRRTGKWFFSAVPLLLVIAAVVVALVLFLPTPQRQETVALEPLAPVQADVIEEKEAGEHRSPPVVDSAPEQLAAVLAVTAPPQTTAEQSRNQAMQALLALWGYTDSLDPVATTTVADLYGLGLLEEEGGLELLRTFNHPALLSLIDAYGDGQFYVLLTALDDANATLIVGTDLVRVPIATLLRQWDGHFSILWQLPPGYEQVLRYGDQGIIVFWLEQQLAALANREPRDMLNLRFDHQLMNEVRRFQRRHGLTADGLVGPRTLMTMNAQMATDQPRLAFEREQ